jgi:hypothetical protein
MAAGGRKFALQVNDIYSKMGSRVCGGRDIACILFRAELTFILHLETGSGGDYELRANILMNGEG